MEENAPRYFIVHKPRNMVSQFISSHKVKLLGDLKYNFPEGIHAVGRLDINSEGLLLLTTNKKITKLLFESEVKHARSYLVQVRHVVTEAVITQLENGVPIRIKGGGDYITTPCKATIVPDPNVYLPIVEERKEYYPNSWILITLTEGKFRQVRKMVAAVKHQCKRLIRVSIEDITLQNLQAGEVKEISETEFFAKLHL